MNQLIVFLILGMTLFLFIWGKIRYDFVSLLALFAVVIFKIIPPDQAFDGFGHPAVITVAAVMIISKGMQNSGLIDSIARLMMKLGKNIYLQILVICTITAVASAFMNNVGALAIMIPVAIHLARKSGYSPSYILMPLAFSSLLGGMMTMIGTPPNIIIATFRQESAGTPFRMFDFAPVGIWLVIAGIIFITFLGWKLLPKRKGQNSEKDLFQIDDYITELRVVEDAKFLGKTVGEIQEMKEPDIEILGLIRNNRRIHIPDSEEELFHEDILIIEADSEQLQAFIDITGFELVGGKQLRKDAIGSKDITVREAIIMNSSKLIGKTAAGLHLRSRYGINLLAVARSNQRLRQRLDKIRFLAGDVLLLQGRSLNLGETITNIGCLPLAERGLRIGSNTKIALTLTIFGSAIIAVVAGLLPVQIVFSLAALLLVFTKVISFREVYDDIDWSVIVLLGAMIPVGMALEVSGGADMIAGQILQIGSNLPVWMILALIMVTTILLSNVINNAATVVLMAPIGLNIAEGLNVSADPILMAIAVSASAAFLTPIGHQSNTLVMAPGGYKFSDYWRMGLPLELIVIALGLPLVLTFWPL